MAAEAHQKLQKRRLRHTLLLQLDVDINIFADKGGASTMDRYGNVLPIVRGVPSLGFDGGIAPLVDLECYGDTSRYFHASQLHNNNAALPRAFGSELTTSAGMQEQSGDDNCDIHHIDARTAKLSYGGIAPPQN